MKRLPYLFVGLILVFAACTATNDAEQAKQAITIDNLKKHVEYLSSDFCEGRKPFSKGAERAVNYLTEGHWSETHQRGFLFTRNTFGAINHSMLRMDDHQYTKRQTRFEA